ncbi:hypothetical protein PYCC9005_002307 [Savitreella phatthalungensis]
MTIHRLAIGDKDTFWHLLEYDTDTNSFKKTARTQTDKASWVSREHDGRIYSVSERSEKPGSVTKWHKAASPATDGEHGADGVQYTEEWSTQTSGEGPCHLDILADEAGRETFLGAANYVGGSVDLLSLETGEILQTIQFNGNGPHERQTSSHCHQIHQDRSTGYVYVCDLGADKVHRYSLESGKLVENAVYKTAPGAGPRHVIFSSGLVYLLNELACTLEILESTPDTLRPVGGTSPVSIVAQPERVGEQHEKYPQPASGAELCITQDKQWLYGSVRYISTAHAADTLFYVRLESRSGLLAGDVQFFDTGLIAPWALETKDDLVCVTFRESKVVRMYGRDVESGELKRLADYKDASLVKPCCVRFL